MDPANVSSDPSENTGVEPRDRGREASVALFARLRDLVGRVPVRPRPGAGHTGSDASAQPRLPGMEAC